MKLLKGSLKEVLYDNPHPKSDPTDSSGSVTPPHIVKETIYSENEVTYISDNIGLHKICNVSDTEPAVSLHLYTPLMRQISDSTCLMKVQESRHTLNRQDFTRTGGTGGQIQIRSFMS